MLFMPGDKIQFVDRWCTATFVSFEYYTRKQSRVEKRKPLFKIDLCDILTVKRAEMKEDKSKKNEDKSYYFEIFLKEELGYDPFANTEDNFASPTKEHSVMSKGSSTSSQTRKPSKFMKPKKSPKYDKTVPSASM